MCAWWEQVSAATDGELEAQAREAALSHALRCAACLSMLNSLVPAPTSGPRPSTLDATALTPRERRWLGGTWTRLLLAAAALIIVVDGIPAYIQGEGFSAESHAARHLASWQIGFGVGVFVAAWMSRMSHAMLALAATFATLTVAATVIDLVGGHRGPRIEAVHLVELIAVFLLWRLTPPHLLPWTRNRSAPSPQQPPPASAQPALHLVRPDPDDQRRTK